MTQETQPATADFASRHSAPDKLLAALSIVMVSNLLVAAHDHELTQERRPVCIERTCGTAALQKTVESSAIESFVIPKPSYTPRTVRSVKPDLVEPKPAQTPISKPLPSKSPIPQTAAKNRPTNTLRRTGIAAHAFVERRAAPTPTDIDVYVPSYDWSYPQRHRTLPDKVGIPVVGLNGGYPGKVNQYLDYQLGWAVSKAQGRTEIYVNTNNPGKYDSDLWPANNKDVRGNIPKNPYGSCRGENSPACSYLRGRDLAEVDEDSWLTPAAKKAGAVIKKIWLDAEGKPWQKGADGQLSNLAVLEGMNDQFRADGYEVGIYAPPNPWHAIVGYQFTPKSTLYGLDEWLPTGSNSLDEAKTACDNPSFTGGDIVMTQYGTTFAGNKIDTDYLCS